MLKISDKNELSVLYKVILDGKFRLDQFSEELSDSTVLAALSDRVYEELSRSVENAVPKSGLSKEQMKLLIPDREELRRIRITQGELKGSYRVYRNYALMNARKDPMFSELGEKERRALVKCCLSPFTCTESEIDEFLSELDGDASGGKDLKKLFGKRDLKGAKLIKAVFYGENSAQLTMTDPMKRARNIDIFFSDVRSFEIKSDSEEALILPELTKFSAASDKLQSLEAVFVQGKAKKTVKISAAKAFCDL